jgi:hypothetical protein
MQYKIIATLMRMWSKNNSHTVGGECKIIITMMENSMEIPQKTRNRITI